MEICCGRALGARQSSKTKTGSTALGRLAADPGRASGPLGPAPAGTFLTGSQKGAYRAPGPASKPWGMRGVPAAVGSGSVWPPDP